jgi:hypothetical protein
MAPKKKKGGKKPAEQQQQHKLKKQKEPVGVKLAAEEIRPGMRCEFCHQAKTRDCLESGSLYRLQVAKVKVAFFSRYFMIFFCQYR